MSIKIKVINTKKDYEEALGLIEKLMNKNPEPNTEDGEKLNLLATLVQDYESRMFPSSLPDPVDAILFRMEQNNLSPADLVPYIGSRSKVSEVLARKRPLTLSMIRSLESGFGIPAKVLLNKTDELTNKEINWTRFPLKEMEKRGYFNQKLSKKSDIKEVIGNFLAPLGTQTQLLGMLRKSNYRFLRPINNYALIAWSTFVIKKAREIKDIAKFDIKKINLDFMKKIAQLSSEKNGPLLVSEMLKKFGIALVIEPHFPQTYLDGAIMFFDKEHPIIGMTVRYDRLDNFWFTLMHELAHLSLHYDQNFNFFYDDLDSSVNIDKKEQEADQLAQEALVPESKWESSPARLIPSPIAAESLAKELGVHTSIVAGKMRHAGNKYIYLNTLINQAKVRSFFPDKKWGK